MYHTVVARTVRALFARINQGDWQAMGRGSKPGYTWSLVKPG